MNKRQFIQRSHTNKIKILTFVILKKFLSVIIIKNLIQLNFLSVIILKNLIQLNYPIFIF